MPALASGFDALSILFLKCPLPSFIKRKLCGVSG